MGFWQRHFRSRWPWFRFCAEEFKCRVLRNGCRPVMFWLLLPAEPDRSRGMAVSSPRARRYHGRPRLQEEIAAPHAGSRTFLGIRPGLRETPTVPGHRRCRFVVRRFGARADDLDRAPRTRTLGRNATGRSGLRRRSEPGKPEGRGSPKDPSEPTAQRRIPPLNLIPMRPLDPSSHCRIVIL